MRQPGWPTLGPAAATQDAHLERWNANKKKTGPPMEDTKRPWSWRPRRPCGRGGHLGPRVHAR
eukprot:804245-Lingulodinium_polyedra.AAC.1